VTGASTSSQFVSLRLASSLVTKSPPFSTSFFFFYFQAMLTVLAKAKGIKQKNLAALNSLIKA